MIAAIAKLYAGRDEEAVARLNRSIELNPNEPLRHFSLAAALAHLGRLEAARAGLDLNPGFSIRRACAASSSDHPVHVAGRERFYEGLRLAGVPEG